MTTTLNHFSRYPKLVSCLHNVKHHMEIEHYDYPLIICGDTGNGKSMLLLHITELWVRVILKEKLEVSHIRHVQNTRLNWIKNFQEIKPLEINANDEGADGLMSKEQVTKFGRDIQKLYSVFRKKRFLTIILIPDFFDLPLYFRKRVRGMIWVNKRGQFKYYTKKGIYYINQLNENRQLKRIQVAYPFFTGTFPDYTGKLRKPYDGMSFEATDNILKEMVQKEQSKMSSVELYDKPIRELLGKGVRVRDIAKELGVGVNTITAVRKKIFIES